MMLLTEDEAKTKICPLSFALADGGSGIMQGGPTTCYTTGCMAWRTVTQESVWLEDGESPGLADLGWRRVRTAREVGGDREKHLWGRGGGYCGAFGEPRS